MFPCRPVPSSLIVLSNAKEGDIKTGYIHSLSAAGSLWASVPHDTVAVRLSGIGKAPACGSCSWRCFRDMHARLFRCQMPRSHEPTRTASDTIPMRPKLANPSEATASQRDAIAHVLKSCGSEGQAHINFGEALVIELEYLEVVKKR